MTQFIKIRNQIFNVNHIISIVRSPEKLIIITTGIYSDEMEGGSQEFHFMGEECEATWAYLSSMMITKTIVKEIGK